MTSPDSSPDLDAEADAEKSRRASTFRIAGMSAFGAPYFISVLLGTAMSQCKKGCGSSPDDYLWLAVPGIGPFVTAGAQGDRIHDEDRAVLLADGILQSVGLLMFMGSWFLDPDRKPPSSGPTTVSFRVAPTMSTSGGGLGITGSF